jgi:hypothetical protein
VTTHTNTTLATVAREKLHPKVTTFAVVSLAAVDVTALPRCDEMLARSIWGENQLCCYLHSFSIEMQPHACHCCYLITRTAAARSFHEFIVGNI